MEPVVLGAIISATATSAVGALSTYVAYRIGKNKTKKGLFCKESNNSGLEKVCPNIDCQEFSELMSKPGKKILVNIWLYGLDTIGIKLKEALKSEETSIEFVILEEDSQFVSIRSKELGLDVKKAIEANKELLRNFISSLTDSQRLRIKI